MNELNEKYEIIYTDPPWPQKKRKRQKMQTKSRKRT